MAEMTKAQLEARLAELEKQLEEEKARNAAAETPAEAKPEEVYNDSDELVPVYLFKDNDRYKDDVFVAVNGKSIQIKRGETVFIKKKFARVLEQQRRQEMAASAYMERQSNEFAAESRRLGI